MDEEETPYNITHLFFTRRFLHKLCREVPGNYFSTSSLPQNYTSQNKVDELAQEAGESLHPKQAALSQYMVALHACKDNADWWKDVCTENMVVQGPLGAPMSVQDLRPWMVAWDGNGLA